MASETDDDASGDETFSSIIEKTLGNFNANEEMPEWPSGTEVSIQDFNNTVQRVKITPIIFPFGENNIESLLFYRENDDKTIHVGVIKNYDKKIITVCSKETLLKHIKAYMVENHISTKSPTINDITDVVVIGTPGQPEYDPTHEVLKHFDQFIIEEGTVRSLVIMNDALRDSLIAKRKLKQTKELKAKTPKPPKDTAEPKEPKAKMAKSPKLVKTTKHALEDDETDDDASSVEEFKRARKKHTARAAPVTEASSAPEVYPPVGSYQFVVGNAPNPVPNDTRITFSITAHKKSLSSGVFDTLVQMIQPMLTK